MTTDAAARHHLYEQARDVLDESAADTLMNALPRDSDPFATKDDLAAFGTAMPAAFAGVLRELRAEITSRNNDTPRHLRFGTIARHTTPARLVFAASTPG